MIEFNLDSFVQVLRNTMYDSAEFPYERDEINDRKHKGRTEHIKDVAFRSNSTMFINDNARSFDIGNYIAERDYPYYHILQDAPVIRKKGRATEKTRGSQEKERELGKRDYGKISFNGKTYSREYAKNVRGARKSVVDNSTQWQNGVKINRSALTYKNIHYKYIDKVLDIAIPQVAQLFGGRMLRKQITSLEDDYNESNMVQNMLSSYLD